MKNEIWKTIDGYDGLYMVSNYGRIKSFKTYRKHDGERLLTPCNKGGYYQVGLRKDEKRKWIGVHRLVAKAFIPNPNNYPCVNHKDENPLNNHVDNLEWCTVLYNNTYGNRIQKVTSKTGKIVLQYSLDGEFIREYSSISEASRQTKTDASAICHCCKGKYNYHQTNGYVWKYKSEVM